MSIEITLHTFLKGKQVGADEFGNRYYIERFASKKRRAKRWVKYNGMAEPSKVPPYWHSWLHYTSDEIPDRAKAYKYAWQKPHLPNLTGTLNRYLPPGHLLKGGKRDRNTADYEPWRPS